MDGNDWVLIIGAIALAIERIYSVIKESKRNAETVERDRAVAKKVEEVRVETKHQTNEVKCALVESSSKSDAKLDTIHTLVNSQMGAQKRMLAITARAKADITHNPTDIAEAERAEDEYRKHETRQQTADEKNK